ncbi:MAG: hypothetical protein GY941_03910 [Planctomycetes bacterium]|nr:hypothetical protein [Planctomycetota bacterium]
MSNRATKTFYYGLDFNTWNKLTELTNVTHNKHPGSAVENYSGFLPNGKRVHAKGFVSKGKLVPDYVKTL